MFTSPLIGCVSRLPLPDKSVQLTPVCVWCPICNVWVRDLSSDTDRISSVSLSVKFKFFFFFYRKHAAKSERQVSPDWRSSIWLINWSNDDICQKVFCQSLQAPEVSFNVLFFFFSQAWTAGTCCGSIIFFFFMSGTSKSHQPLIYTSVSQAYSMTMGLCTFVLPCSPLLLFKLYFGCLLWCLGLDTTQRCLTSTNHSSPTANVRAQRLQLIEKDN